MDEIQRKNVANSSLRTPSDPFFRVFSMGVAICVFSLVFETTGSSQASPVLAPGIAFGHTGSKLSTQRLRPQFGADVSSWNGCFVRAIERGVSTPEPRQEGAPAVLPSGLGLPGPRTLFRLRADDRLVRPFADHSRTCTVIEESCQRSTPTPANWVLETFTKICQLEVGIERPAHPTAEPFLAMHCWPSDYGVARTGFQLDLDHPPKLS
jgi:hypothetical protein